MRKFGVLLLGLALVCGAVGMFGYRWATKTDRHVGAPAASAVAPSDSRRNILTDQRHDTPPGSGTTGSDRGAAVGWASLELVLNALNALCGIVGVWMAWLGLRMQRAVAAMQAARPRDGGHSPPLT